MGQNHLNSKPVVFDYPQLKNPILLELLLYLDTLPSWLTLFISYCNKSMWFIIHLSFFT